MSNSYFLDDAGQSLWIRKAETREPVAALSYSIRSDPFNHLYITNTASREKRQGHFNTLYKRAEEIARENNCKSIRLKTGLDNEHSVARAVFNKKGFTYLPQEDPLDKQRGRIGMEKLL